MVITLPSLLPLPSDSYYAKLGRLQYCSTNARRGSLFDQIHRLNLTRKPQCYY